MRGYKWKYMNIQCSHLLKCLLNKKLVVKLPGFDDENVVYLCELVPGLNRMAGKGA